jgi:hypothetical protein
LGHRWWWTFFSGWRETWDMVIIKKDKVSNGFWFKNHNVFYSKSDTWSNQMTGEKWSIAIKTFTTEICPRSLNRRWWWTFFSGWREMWTMVIIKKDIV